MENSTINAALNKTIGDLQQKSLEVGESDFTTKINADRVKAAQARIGSAEARVDKANADIQQTNELLNPEPTMEESLGGKSGGTKTVTDQEEVKRLTAQKSAQTEALNQAKQQVELARSDAQEASNEAIQASGVSQERIQEMSSLQSRVSSLKSDLEAGNDVSDDDILSVASDIDTLIGGLTQDDNKGDSLGNAFYDPVARDLKDILALKQQAYANEDEEGAADAGAEGATVDDASANAASAETSETTTSEDSPAITAATATAGTSA